MSLPAGAHAIFDGFWVTLHGVDPIARFVAFLEAHGVSYFDNHPNAWMLKSRSHFAAFFEEAHRQKVSEWLRANGPEYIRDGNAARPKAA